MQQETAVDKKSLDVTRLERKNSNSRLRKGATTSSCYYNHDKKLVKCINRKVQVSSKRQSKPYVKESCSRLTSKIRCRVSPKITEFKKNIGNLSTCPENTFRSCGDLSRKKSLSMVEISPNKCIDRLTIGLRSPQSLILMGQGTPKIPCLITDSTSMIWSNGESKNCNKDVENVTKKAGMLVCHVLAINAWRRRREEVGELHRTIEELGQQIDHLQLQIVVLRKLLDTENSRIGKLGAEVHRAKTLLDSVTREKENVREEKRKLEVDIKELKQLSEERKVAAENFKNDLFSVKDQLTALDAQMIKEREKVLKLREDKKVLLEKVSTSCKLANEHGERAEIAERTIEELQDKLSIHKGIIECLQEDKLQLVRDLKNCETEKVDFKKRFATHKDIEKSLNKRIKNLENQLSDRETALRRIESLYNSQIVELNELRERLIKQSLENGWSSKVLQIVGSVIRAPRVILRTLSFLAPGGIAVYP